MGSDGCLHNNTLSKDCPTCLTEEVTKLKTQLVELTAANLNLKAQVRTLEERADNAYFDVLRDGERD